MGYAPQSAEGLDALLLRHPDFSEKHSFVLTDADGVRGFVSGVTGDALAQGRVRGYFSCLLLDPAADSDENTALLLARLRIPSARLAKASPPLPASTPCACRGSSPAPTGTSTTTCQASLPTLRSTAVCSRSAGSRRRPNRPCISI